MAAELVHSAKSENAGEPERLRLVLNTSDMKWNNQHRNCVTPGW